MNYGLVRIVAAIVFAVVLCFTIWVTKSGWCSVLLLLMMPIWYDNDKEEQQ